MTLDTTIRLISTGMISTDNIMWNASGVPQSHTLEQFKMLYADGLTHKNANISKYWEQKAAVLSASNAEEIASISW